MKDKIDWKTILLTGATLLLTIGADVIGSVRNDRMMKEEIDQAVNDALENRESEES